MDHDDAFTRHKLEVSDRAHADGEPTEAAPTMLLGSQLVSQVSVSNVDGGGRRGHADCSRFKSNKKKTQTVIWHFNNATQR